MAEHAVHGIVLRRRDSGESDRRLTLLTPEFGKLDAIAKGARKSASRLAGVSDPLSAAIFNLADGKRNRFVTQAQPLHTFRGLRRDFDRLTYALALCELAAAVLPWEEPAPEAYELLTVALGQLEGHDKPEVALAWSEVRLLELSGFMPSLDHCVQTGEPVAESPAWLSASAGGYVVSTEAGKFADRFQARAEVLVGLAKLVQLDAPPPALRFADECLLALIPFWRAVADLALPANDTVWQTVRERRMNETA